MKVSDEEIVSALMTQPTNEAAAVAVGLSLRHFYVRLKTDAVKSKLREAQQLLVRNALDEMRKNLSDSTAVIVSVMNDKAVPAQTRINAADMLQRNYLKLSERQDILERLEHLEDLFK